MDRSRLDRDFDACVVGAGPAGITLARRLAARGLAVALMEGCGLDVAPEAQDLYIGEVAGLGYLDLEVVRLRCLGGSSTHWSGRCRVLDAEDFVALPQRPRAWPIGKAELDLYQPEAAAILDLAEPVERPDLPVRQAENRFREIPWRFSPPTRFGEKYLGPLAADPRITLCLNANLTDLRLAPDLATVEAAHFRSYVPGDPGFAVRARAYALCAGGLENPRILLNACSQKPAGIGNDHDLVGRFFCEHLHLRIAETLYRKPLGIQQYSLAATPELIARAGVLNFAVILESRDHPVQPLGMALRATAQCLTPLTERLARRLLGRAPECKWGGVEEYLARRDPESHSWGWVWMHTEQSLQRDSRVRLTEARDALGMRRIALEWRLAEIDQRTIRAAVLALGAHMAEQDIGRIKVRERLLEEPMPLAALAADGMIGSFHHMCTTRMAEDPREGVVDADCRVHGTANLYVGGSSVFATAGFANPTLTIVQLALRLGDHLGGQLQI